MAGQLHHHDAATGYKVATALDKVMNSYHAFGEINTETTLAIIEAGYLKLDQQIPTQKLYVIAQGIVDGLLCFIHNENVIPTQTFQVEVPTQVSP